MIPKLSEQIQGRLKASAQSDKHVAILLSTYNGEDFLSEQLDSLTQQTHTDWSVYASDDGSSDATLNILQSYRERIGINRMHILKGPQHGFAANFLSMLRREEIQASYFAFCDQDDVWGPERLEAGIRWMQQLPVERPMLYCSRTLLIDAQGSPIGASPLFVKPPCFENALVQSIAGGNTMLLNGAARDLLKQTPPDTKIISHDWWAYILVSGCGGAVAYNKEPTVHYRLHGKNIIGSKSELQDRLSRVRKMLHGTFREWNDANLKAISTFKKQLTQENLNTLELFEQSRQANLLTRLRLIHQSGVHRQTLADTLGLAAAAILQRL
ncbi:glycosyltransferase family 2 protein [Pseudomonas sp. C32]|uniref:glycosyltransferase family 2 protein n=1 Tax=Pseudomonas sp. C32 TaxID=1529208 RepID=UPI0026035404|nr:glycosyltransferase family 2 protein [Pseudomonas sp. C32]MDN4547982.1 glycosyltransferase family 2 protein [Pseudomonas sp. C32]